MTEYGRVHEVTAEELGSTLITSHLLGDTTLFVKSSLDFDVDGGDLAYIDPADEDATITQEYLTVDHLTGFITLAVGLPDALEHDTLIHVVSADEESTLTAQVMFEDEDEPASVRVPYGMRDKFPEGVREPDKREAVVVEEEDDGELVIGEVVGKVPSISATYVDTPYTRAYLTADKNIPTDAWTTIYDWTVFSAHPSITLTDIAGAYGFFSIADPGIYLVIGTIGFEVDPDGARGARIFTRDAVTAVIDEVAEVFYAARPGGMTQIQVVGTVVIPPGQESTLLIAISGYQTSGGGALAAKAFNPVDTRCEIVRIA